MGGVHFSEKVQMFLTAKFEVGERTGERQTLRKWHFAFAVQEMNAMKGCLKERSS